MIAIAVLLFATADVGIKVHLIPYLTGIGYPPTSAAGLFAAMFVFSAIGSFAVGYLADSFGGRLMLTAVFVTASAGIAALLGAAHFASIAMFIVVFGLVRQTHLLPLVIGESLGIPRLGSILGFLALFATIGFAAGPAIAGRIFDVTGSYSGAWLLFMAMALVSALAMRATLPLRQETSAWRRSDTTLRDPQGRASSTSLNPNKNRNFPCRLHRHKCITARTAKPRRDSRRPRCTERPATTIRC